MLEETKVTRVLEETKPIWKSKGVWGGAIAVLAAFAGLAGYAVTPDRQAQILEAGALIASGVGGLVAVWGRVVATKRIT
jgi:hypothetical protein